MSISLNNHEDRLQSIERRDWWPILDSRDVQIPQGSNFVEICRYNPVEVKMIFIHFTHDFNTATPNPEHPYNTTPFMTILPAGKESYECKIWPISLTSQGGAEAIYVKINVGAISVKTIGPNTNDNYIMTIYGFGDINKLKLYYNFSYNIYRLANSISFHFFKCLINSFKGGVKEIWQLVLRTMKIV